MQTVETQLFAVRKANFHDISWAPTFTRFREFYVYTTQLQIYKNRENYLKKNKLAYHALENAECPPSIFVAAYNGNRQV